ncbi:hypothetical protein [Rice Tombus-like virus 2]|nr:hypothetical protein [Rice Tombus-like virus 2]
MTMSTSGRRTGNRRAPIGFPVRKNKAPVGRPGRGASVEPPPPGDDCVFEVTAPVVRLPGQSGQGFHMMTPVPISPTQTNSEEHRDASGADVPRCNNTETQTEGPSGEACCHGRDNLPSRRPTRDMMGFLFNPLNPGVSWSDFRHRQRSRVTNQIQNRLASSCWVRSNESGGQSSSHLVTTWQKTLSQWGAKVVDGDRVLLSDDGKTDEMLVIRQDGCERFVSLGMYTRLCNYVYFRERTHDLIHALRSKAVQISKEMGMDEKYVALVLPGTVVLAHMVNPIERSQWSSLAASSGRRTAVVNQEYSSHTIPSRFVRSGLDASSWVDNLVHLCVGGSRATTAPMPRRLPVTR